MDSRSETREFLVARRGRITPEQAGLPTFGHVRRVPGLRREEVALLAGVSVDYYTRLERGNLAGTSESVLRNLARALQLDDAERDYLDDLARAANANASFKRAPRRRAARTPVRPSVQRLLDALVGSPAFVQDERGDVLAANRLGRALYAPLFERPGEGNHGRFVFFDDRSRDFYPDWELAADITVELLHKAAGRDPHNRALTDLVGQLSTRSDEFRTRWAAHKVRFHTTGVKRFNHPVVGLLELTFEGMELTADDGLTLFSYTAEPGSTSADALGILGSWAATLDETGTAAPDRGSSAQR